MTFSWFFRQNLTIFLPAHNLPLKDTPLHLDMIKVVLLINFTFYKEGYICWDDKQNVFTQNLAFLLRAKFLEEKISVMLLL